MRFSCSKGKNRFYVLMCALLPSISVAQTTWHVAPPPVGQDDGSHNGLSWIEPFASITNALDNAASNNGDMIYVSNGTYNLTAHIDVDKGVTIRSWNNGGLDRDGTIVDGGGAVRCFYIRHANAIVQGLTITNGYPPSTTLSGYGGGVFLNEGQLRDCVVTGNRSGSDGAFGGRGGGIYQGDSAGPVISNCIIRGNVCESMNDLFAGGGVMLNGGILQDSLIEGNEVISGVVSRRLGGGVQLRGNATLIDSQITSNIAASCGGVYIVGPNNIISNCTINGNSNSGIGLANSGELRAGNLIVVSNIAGGVFAGGNDCSLEIHDSDIIHNIDCDLGALLVRGWGLISNCNISFNSGSTARGAVNFYRTSSGPGSGTVTHSRVVGNIFVGDGSDYSYGAGVRVGANSYGLLIENCEIRDNVVTNADRAYGGGLSLSSNVVVRNTLITGNWAYGTHVDASRGGVGAGAYVPAGASNLLESCTIVGNYAKRRGGGVYMAGAGDDIVMNSVVSSNIAGDGALYDDWGFEDAARKTNITYTCTPDADGTWGAGCTSADPLFADPGTGNYRLRAGSPGINTGLNQTDWMPGAMDLDGRPRIDRFSGVVDMGCYEYISSGAMFYVH